MGFEFLRVDRTGTGSEKWAVVPEHIRKSGSIPLSLADMEVATAPAIIEAMEKAARHGVVGYTMPDGPYREAVISWIQRRHGYTVAPEAIRCTFGVVAALNICVRAFTQPGEGIIIQTPVYPPFHNAVRNNGRVLVENPLINENGRYTMDYADLERKAKDPNNKLLILCSPHNPAGRVWTEEELLRLGNICRENGVLVLSDEIHFDLALRPDRPHHMFCSLGQAFADNAIVCTALSKTFNLAGLCCSNILISNENLRKIYDAQVLVEGFDCIPYFAYAATIAAYTQCDAWYEALLDLIRDNNRVAEDLIRERIPQAVVSPLEGTYLMWVDLTFLGLYGEEFDRFLAEDAGVWLDRGKKFGQAGDGFVRINLATQQSDVVDVIGRLADAIAAR